MVYVWALFGFIFWLVSVMVAFYAGKFCGVDEISDKNLVLSLQEMGSQSDNGEMEDIKIEKRTKGGDKRNGI